MSVAGKITLYIDGEKVSARSYNTYAGRQRIIDHFVMLKDGLEHSESYYVIKPYMKKPDDFSRLTPDDIAWIKENYKYGSAMRGTNAMAHKFNVSTSIITWVVRPQHLLTDRK